MDAFSVCGAPVTEHVRLWHMRIHDRLPAQGNASTGLAYTAQWLCVFPM